MKKYLAIICIVTLSGCVVAPVPHNGRVVVYPQVDFTYYWDPAASRHYYNDRRGDRRYMPHGWNDDRDRGRGHRHGRGHD